ncbi:hypothetical protein SERN_1516 [Serinibacter arcticus]|uniref:Uncharacterized protein n=1 Tax=Serinibacter arcticus TaxID=1655435 RepID=A0A4Z1E412_9MICO|nr:hypothetical protein SERN_1516 [Serinibacter arcticus]
MGGHGANLGRQDDAPASTGRPAGERSGRKPIGRFSRPPWFDR